MAEDPGLGAPRRRSSTDGAAAQTAAAAATEAKAADSNGTTVWNVDRLEPKQWGYDGPAPSLKAGMFPNSAGARLQTGEENLDAVGSLAEAEAMGGGIAQQQMAQSLRLPPGSGSSLHKRHHTVGGPYGGIVRAVSRATSGLLGHDAGHRSSLPHRMSMPHRNSGTAAAATAAAATAAAAAAAAAAAVAGGEGEEGEAPPMVAWRQPASKAEEPELIYEKDIHMPAAQPGLAPSASDVVVQAHRKRVRVKKTKKKKKKKKKQPAKPDRDRRKSRVVPRRLQFGRPIKNDPDSMLLTLGMMLGLRVAVGRQENPMERQELTVTDFYQVDKYVFPPSGAMGVMVTPPHKLGHTFKFKDYAPKVFKRIREHFGVDRMRYMLSVAGNYQFLEFITNARSGQFFFYSHDESFMIKTMKKAETRFLRRILPHYYEHIRRHPDTFLVRFCGMYRVKMHHINRKVHFMVMSSVYDTHKDIHTMFDLKGSTAGRYKNAGESVGKDLDLVRSGNKLHLGRQREAFLKVIENDVAFLAKMKIMDYSLLLGIHDRTRPPDANTSCRPHYDKFITFADDVGADRAANAPQRSSELLGAAAAAQRAEGDGDEYDEDVEDDASPRTNRYASRRGSAYSLRSVSPGSPMSTGSESGGGNWHRGSTRGGGGGGGGGGSTSGESDDQEDTDEAGDTGDGTGTEEDFSDHLYTDGEGDGSFLGPLPSAPLLLPAPPLRGSGAGGAAAAATRTPSPAASLATTVAAAAMATPAPGSEDESGDGAAATGGGLSRCSTAPTSLAAMAAAAVATVGGGAAAAVSGAGSAAAAAVAAMEAMVAANAATLPMHRAAAGGGGGAGAGPMVLMGRRHSVKRRMRPGGLIERRSDLGIYSDMSKQDEPPRRGNEIYFMGIIDVLQEYNIRKHAETALKSLRKSKNDISCVEPELYASRFLHFMREQTD